MVPASVTEAASGEPRPAPLLTGLGFCKGTGWGTEDQGKGPIELGATALGLAPVGRRCWNLGGSGGEAEPAALHADLQAVSRLAAGVQDATVQVAGQVAVGTLAGAAAAAAEARVLGAAGAARGAVQDNVAERQELAEQAGQDAVHAAVCGGRGRGENGSAQVRKPGAGTQPQRWGH